MPRVTVVIPCFNHGRYVDEAVDSVLRQTFLDVEIVIVDDGSTDPATVAHLADYRREKTRVLRIPNSGPCVARNRGIAEGAGEYILPLDADDRIGDTYIEKAVRLLDGDPRLGIVYCEAEYFGARNGPWELSPFTWPEMLWKNAIFVTAMFRRADWHAAGGFSESMRGGYEDWDFWLTLIGRGAGVHRIPECLFSYRISESGRWQDMLSDRRRTDAAFARMVMRHVDLYAAHVDVLFEQRPYLERREGAGARVALYAMVHPFPLAGFPRRFYAATKLLVWCAFAPTRRLPPAPG